MIKKKIRYSGENTFIKVRKLKKITIVLSSLISIEEWTHRYMVVHSRSTLIYN